MYFSDINGKINYLTFYISQSKGKKIIFLDFDTTISSLVQSNLLMLSKNQIINLDLIIPNEKEILKIIDKVFDLLQCNCVLIIDSINGLIDCLNFSTKLIIRPESPRNNNTKVKNINNNITNINMNNKDSKNLKNATKLGFYQALNLLHLLQIKAEYKKIPILVTFYQSNTKIEYLKQNLFKSEDAIYKNHYINIAKSIILVDHINSNNNNDITGITIYKITENNKNKCSSGQKFFPLSIYLSDNNIKELKKCD